MERQDKEIADLQTTSSNDDGDLRFFYNHYRNNNTFVFTIVLILFHVYFLTVTWT
jgi:hypothetical protein